MKAYEQCFYEVLFVFPYFQNEVWDFFFSILSFDTLGSERVMLQVRRHIILICTYRLVRKATCGSDRVVYYCKRDYFAFYVHHNSEHGEETLMVERESKAHCLSHLADEKWQVHFRIFFSGSLQ